jgi:predicted NodU family carbamoyl transferase
MNILAIHTSHDGCITYVKNNKIIFHTQLDRYSRFKHTTFPVKSVFDILNNIKVDKILITSLGPLTLPSTPLWKNMLETSTLKNVPIIFYEDYYHHLFHAYCALTWDKKIKNILVCDGTGAKYGDNWERESLYFNNKKLEHVSTESNAIGHRYEVFTGKHFSHGLDCGKTMAWSLYDERPAKIQENFENEMTELMNQWNLKKDIHFTGGCAQNVLYNSKLLNKTKNLFCDPFNGDFGITIGAANFYLGGKIKNDNIYLGVPQELNTDIFLKHKIYNVTPDEVAKVVLNEPVAIFQSRSEQGQRGLGNRSLLMNPIHKKAHDKMNAIKKREWFRPFACSILKEKAKEWFEMPIEESPYMMYVFKIKKEGVLQTGLSKNNDSRIQTVSKKNNLHYYNLIKAFDKLTNIPILINTSLNLPGEVLVETMQDLKDLFDKSKLNYIYLPEIGKMIKKNNY